MYGKIVTFKPEKGFGFIRFGDEDVFFHITDFPPGIEPQVGLSVEFRIGKRRERQLALDIKLLGEPRQLDVEAQSLRTVLGGAR